MIVDQPASIGALPIAVARFLNIEVAYLPGLAMRRIADLHPGEGKTDSRDAYIIADAARTMPHTLRRVGTDDDTPRRTQPFLAGYDDLAAQSTRLTNRLRDALLHIHPALERLLGPRLERGGVLDLLVAAPPHKLCAISVRPASPRSCDPDPRGWPRRCRPRSSPRSTRRPSSFPAPPRSGVSSPESLRSCAMSASNATPLATELEARLEAHPLAEVLTSMPGLGSGPRRRSSPSSATAPRSPPPGTSPPTPASPLSPEGPGPR